MEIYQPTQKTIPPTPKGGSSAIKKFSEEKIDYINRVAEVAQECNRLSKEYAKLCYKRAMNVLFTETGKPYVIDEKVLEEYESVRYELNAKIDELDEAIKGRDIELENRRTT